jgi:prephenate dehydratase
MKVNVTQFRTDEHYIADYYTNKTRFSLLQTKKVSVRIKNGFI